jgi:phage shock protein A
MTIARRIAELYNVKMNAALDRVADPRDLVDYTYVQLQELLAEVRRGTAQIAASRKRAESRASDLRRAADRLSEQAEQAVLAGRDDLARQALARRATISSQVSRLREQQDALRAEEQKMADAGRRLQEKVDAFGVRREAIKAAYTAARAQASIAEALAGISGDVTDAGTAAGRAEDQEADLQARASALDDLLASATPGGAAALSDEQLQAQLDQISTQAEVDEELARLRERLAAGADQGHRAIPHAADVRIEAWAPTREECLAEAARGLAGSFAVVAAARPRRTAERRFIARSDEDLLVAIIEEVIYRLDADGEIPVTVTVRAAPDGGVMLSMQLADVGQAEITGPMPKAASLHNLRCAPSPPGRWSCGITIDVQKGDEALLRR